MRSTVCYFLHSSASQCLNVLSVIFIALLPKIILYSILNYVHSKQHLTCILNTTATFSVMFPI